jgi:hypothetical protein
MVIELLILFDILLKLRRFTGLHFETDGWLSSNQYISKIKNLISII